MKIQKLVKLKGIGAEFATVLVGEVFFRPFANRQQLASYVGLTPSPFQSGSMSRDQGISKAGNPKARTTMVELAWMWLRHQPGSSLSAWFRERVGTRKGRIRRITIVAMARKLLIALFRSFTTSATENPAKPMLAIGNAAAYCLWGVPGSLVVGATKRTLRKDVERGLYLRRFCIRRSE
jgi:Transposase IS116/IS110/IS902 family